MLLNGLGSHSLGSYPWVSPEFCLLNSIFEYLLHLKDSGLAFISIKLHLLAISALHNPIAGPSIFLVLISKKFLKGLFNLQPPVPSLFPSGVFHRCSLP